MSYGNPYENKSPDTGGQGNGGGSRGGFNGGGGGGNAGGGRFPQREPLTPEQLHRLRLPVTIVLTGNDGIPDSDAMTMDRFIKMIEAKRVTMRSAHATETDMIVSKGARYVEYHTPWKGFAPRNGEAVEVKGAGSSFNTDECFEYAKRYFVGDFEQAPKLIRALNAKNARLLFGKNLKNPTQLVIVWSEDGVEAAASTTSRSGNVGHLVRLASAAGIPVINIKSPNAESRLTSFLENIYVQQPPVQQAQQPAAAPAAAGYDDRRSNQGSGRSGFGASPDDDIPF